jgi:Pterin binding enzyme
MIRPTVTEPLAALDRPIQAKDNNQFTEAYGRPDSIRIPVRVEIERLAPVIAHLQARGALVSVDTFRPEVQTYALLRGVAFLNDIQENLRVVLTQIRCTSVSHEIPRRQDVRVGDKVKLGANAEGVVVCSIDTGEYSKEHPEAQWGYLKKGAIIDFPKYGLIHYVEPEDDLELVARATVIC